MSGNTGSEPDLRPRDLAMLLLASAELQPRKRARDQRSDIAGVELKRQLLQRVAQVDPNTEDLATALTEIVEQFGERVGAARAIARDFMEEFQAAATHPEFLAWLLHQAART